MSSPKSPHFSAGKKNVVYFHPTTSLAKQSETSGESFPKAVLQIQEISHWFRCACTAYHQTGMQVAWKVAMWFIGINLLNMVFNAHGASGIATTFIKGQPGKMAFDQGSK